MKTQNRNRNLAAVAASSEVRELRADLALAVPDGEKARRFSMLAYTGGIIKFPGENFAIDLEGLSWPARAIPILIDHISTDRVGFSDRVELSERGLEVGGKFLRSARAKEILSDAEDGFPFQASVRVAGTKIEQVESGSTAQVNGRTLTGPGLIYRESDLREVSFCSLGADPDTSAQALAHRRGIMAGKKDGADSTADSTAAKGAGDARAEARAEFQARVAKLSKAAELPRQAELVMKLAASETALEDALLEIVEDLKAAAAAMVSKLEESKAAKAKSKEDEDEEDEEEEEEENKERKQAASEVLDLVGKLRGSPATEILSADSGDPDDLQTLWKADKKLREEFIQFEHFKAFREAEALGLVSIVNDRK
ncbi:MAG: hypothetical protein M0R66_04305 [Candidatus Omnitrophica bacterium]|jgi:hypothetical protein|nr:hypothetical protein [Candidatus Omnitrophota bacterium]